MKTRHFSSKNSTENNHNEGLIFEDLGYKCLTSDFSPKQISLLPQLILLMQEKEPSSMSMRDWAQG